MDYLRKHGASSTEWRLLPTPSFLATDDRLFLCYPADISIATKAKRFQTLKTCFFYTGLLVLVTAVTFLLSRSVWVKCRTFGLLATMCVTVVSIGATVWGVHDGRLYCRGAILITCLCGITLGMWSRWYKSHKSCFALEYSDSTHA